MLRYKLHIFIMLSKMAKVVGLTSGT